MRIFVFFVVAVFFNSLIFAQQYIIKYDVSNDNLKYFEARKKGDTVEVPVINLSRSGKVNLRLQNIAGSFADSIAYDQKQEENEKIQNPFWDGIKGFLAVPSNIIPGMEKWTKKEEEKNEPSYAGTRTALGEYKLVYSSFLEQYKRWAKSAAFSGNCEKLWKELAAIRYSLQYPAEEAKQIANTRAATIFPKINEQSTIVQMFEMAETESLQKNLDAMAALYSKTMAAAANTELNNNHIVDSLQKDITKWMAIANEFSNKPVYADKEFLLSKILTLYQQIMQDQYTRNRPLQIDRNTKSILLTLKPQFPKSDSATALLMNIKETDIIKLSIPVYKKSPIRFRNTYGLSFVAFAENKWHYFIKTKNSIHTIEKETADYFQPVVSSFLHFYAPRDKGFRWGGSFGAGVPINSTDTKVNIMLGLSTFFGKNDPLSISAGCVGTKVKKLSGYQVGDVVAFTELDDGKHYNSVYRIGYFLSITFNPAGLVNKN